MLQCSWKVCLVLLWGASGLLSTRSLSLFVPVPSNIALTSEPSMTAEPLNAEEETEVVKSNNNVSGSGSASASQRGDTGDSPSITGTPTPAEGPWQKPSVTSPDGTSGATLGHSTSTLRPEAAASTLSPIFTISSYSSSDMPTMRRNSTSGGAHGSDPTPSPGTTHEASNSSLELAYMDGSTTGSASTPGSTSASNSASTSASTSGSSSQTTSATTSRSNSASTSTSTSGSNSGSNSTSNSASTSGSSSQTTSASTSRSNSASTSASTSRSTCGPPASTEALKCPPPTASQPCSTRGLVSQCLIAIASLAGLAAIFMVSTVVLCAKLSTRKTKVRKPQPATEMMCISSLLPEKNYTYTRQRNPVPNGVLVIHNAADSDEDGGDNLTLSSFLPESDRFV